MTAAQQEDSSCPAMMSFCRCDIFLLPKWWNLAGLEHNRQQLVTARLYVDWAWMLLTRFLSSMPYLKCLIDHSDALTLNYKQAHFLISMLGNRKENVSQLLCGKAIPEGNFSQRLSETKMASDQDSRLDLGVRTRRWTVCWCCSDMGVHFLKWSYIKTKQATTTKKKTPLFSRCSCAYIVLHDTIVFHSCRLGLILTRTQLMYWFIKRCSSVFKLAVKDVFDTIS